jgi:hypothetical protein
MKKLLIVYPHWPPSNLSGVHRSRLIANYSRDFGWDVKVLTVDAAFYEEANDPEIERLVSPHISVEKVTAFPVLKILGRRMIGDIGIRGWFQMRRRMLHILRSEVVDFIWIPIPSWYTSLLGRVASRKFKVPFGIDYIDPWVYQLTSHEKRFSRQWWTRQVALRLEPIAIRKTHLISGVAEEYYKPALQRVFLDERIPHTIAMPYGFDPNDHKLEPSNLNCPWEDLSSPFLLYAGAFLPHSEKFIRVMFTGISNLYQVGAWPEGLKIRFVGTGKRTGDSISTLAAYYGVQHIVEEYPDRIPFLSVQALLRKAQGTLVIGSTEAHYTASKTFQCLLAGNPVFAMFHASSSAAMFMEDANAANYLVKWEPNNDALFAKQTRSKLEAFINDRSSRWQPDMSQLAPYSSKESARILFAGIDTVLKT